MKLLTSRDNPLFKRLLRLSQGRPERVGQAHEGYRVLLEGEHLCAAWLEHRGAPDLWVLDESRQSYWQDRFDHCMDDDRIAVLGSALFKQLSHVESSQGIACLATVVPAVRPVRITQTSLWLDRVQDPGNVGTLLRTAAAAGVQHVYLSTGTAAAWSPKVVRSAQGAHFVVSIYEHVDLLQECERLDVPLLATGLADAVSLYAAALPAQAVWVMGHEGQGVDRQLLAKAHRRIFIPQVPSVESLNVGVAAGIVLFEQRRQHMAALTRADNLVC